MLIQIHSNRKFVMMPENNDEFWEKNPKFGLLHLYIVERVRSFSNSGLPCFISNAQFARETNTSISSVSRAIKELVAANILWANYHHDNKTNKQRVIGMVYQKPDSHNEYAQKPHNIKCVDAPQIDNVCMSPCKPEMVPMTRTDSQNEALVYKNKLEEDNKNISDNFYLENIDWLDESSFRTEGNIDGTAEIVGSCEGISSSYNLASLEDNKRESSCNYGISMDETISQRNDEDTLMAKKQLEEYQSLSSEEREELISDIEYGLLAEEDMPQWGRICQKHLHKYLGKIGCPSIDDLSPFVRSVCIGNAFSEVESELKAAVKRSCA